MDCEGCLNLTGQTLVKEELIGIVKLNSFYGVDSMGVLPGLGAAFVGVIVILLVLVMITLDTGAWWYDLKGLSRKQKVIGVIFLMIMWLVIGFIIGNIEVL